MKKAVSLLMALVLMVSLAACSSSGSSGKDLPKNMEVQVPANAGGGTDVMARALATYVTQNSDSNLTIVNNTDGSGVVAMETVRVADPDASVILQFHATMMIKIATGVYDKSITDDFTVIGVSQMADPVSNVLVVSADSGITTLDELIDSAKAAPGELLFGVETGGSTHIQTGMFVKSAGIEVKYAEAGSDTEKLTALVGNSIDACFVNPNQAKQYVEAGRVVALAGISRDERGERGSVLPDVPSFVELGYDFTFSQVNLFLGPKGMDEELARKIYDLYAAASRDEEVNKILGPAGFGMEFLSFEDGPERIKTMQESITAVVEDLGLAG